MRPPPRITPREIVARAIIDPNGEHQLEVTVPNGVVGMIFDTLQVAQLKSVISQFETQSAFADGGPDFHHRKTIPLEATR